MKKIGLLLILGMLSFSLAGCGDPCKDDVFTGIGDSIATMGKEGLEKEKILAERTAKRAAACAERTGNQMKKSLGL
ncbi:MAG: hypothetical protein A2Z83_08770 [Omnitrophica bacterium GWA2_52_8]|nr:MAG: hypothetical protein A2Z83_08770 [Omnitrophica bacterium GWA2_52_8]